MYEYLILQQRYCFFLEMGGKLLLKICKSCTNVNRHLYKMTVYIYLLYLTFLRMFCNS